MGPFPLLFLFCCLHRPPSATLAKIHSYTPSLLPTSYNPFRAATTTGSEGNDDARGGVRPCRTDVDIEGMPPAMASRRASSSFLCASSDSAHSPLLHANAGARRKTRLRVDVGRLKMVEPWLLEGDQNG